jgi:hypothetical protein
MLSKRGRQIHVMINRYKYNSTSKSPFYEQGITGRQGRQSYQRRFSCHVRPTPCKYSFQVPHAVMLLFTFQALPERTSPNTYALQCHDI